MFLQLRLAPAGQQRASSKATRGQLHQLQEACSWSFQMQQSTSKQHHNHHATSRPQLLPIRRLQMQQLLLWVT